MLGGTELAALGPRLRLGLPFESTKNSPIGLEEKTVMSERNACIHLSSVCNLSGGGPQTSPAGTSKSLLALRDRPRASIPRARRMPNRECAVPRPELPTGHVSLMPLYLSISPPIMSWDVQRRLKSRAARFEGPAGPPEFPFSRTRPSRVSLRPHRPPRTIRDLLMAVQVPA